MRTKAHIEPGKLWTYCQGYKWGLRTPLLEGTISINLRYKPDFQILDAFIENLTGESFGYRDSPSFQYALVSRLVFFSSALQRHFSFPVFESGLIHSHTETSYSGSFNLALSCYSPEVGKEILQWLINLGNLFLASPDKTLPAKFLLDHLSKRLAPFHIKGLNTFRFLKAAFENNIPSNNLGKRVVVYGYGSKSVWLESSTTENTSWMATRIACDKRLSSFILAEAGFPVPIQKSVSNEQNVLQIANEIGYPVVIKPADREQGKGVFSGIKNPDKLLSAFKSAREISRNILIEKHVEGFSHRLTVFHGKVIKISKKIPGGVIGDGKHSIKELLDIFYNRPENQISLRERGKRLTLDEEALELLSDLKMSVDSIPEPNQFICLRRRANSSAGGTSERLQIDQVHPDNIQLAIRASQLIKLDLAGIDIISPDISKSWLEIETAICEINSQPQISDNGSPDTLRNILLELMDHQPRIPVLVIASDLSESHFLDALTNIKTPYRVAFSSINGLWLNKQQVSLSFKSSFSAAKSLLMARESDMGIMLMSPAELEKYGLPVDLCDELLIAEKHEKLVEIFKDNTLKMTLSHETQISKQKVCELFIEKFSEKLNKEAALTRTVSNPLPPTI